MNATIVNVPEVVNVWIVCQPLVVIVPPVDVGDTPSLPSVAYDIISKPLPPLYPAAAPARDTHQPPHPVFAVPTLPFQELYASPFPPQPVPHNHLAVYHPQPPHEYVTDAPLIEFAVPFHQAHPVQPAAAVPFAQTADAPPQPLVALADAHHANPVPCDAVDVPAVPAGQAHHPLHQFPQFITHAQIPPHHPQPHNAVFVAKVVFPPDHH